MNTIEYDTDSMIDTANGRLKPTKNGYYRVAISLFHSMNGTGGFTITSAIFKNGLPYKSSSQLVNYTSGFSQTMTINAIVQFNGTTDYLEAYTHTNSENTALVGAAGTWISVEFIRSL